jgi:hypothetical protein
VCGCVLARGAAVMRIRGGEGVTLGLAPRVVGAYLSISAVLGFSESLVIPRQSEWGAHPTLVAEVVFCSVNHRKLNWPASRVSKSPTVQATSPSMDELT